MSENARTVISETDRQEHADAHEPVQRARAVTTIDRGKLDVKALVLLAVLLAAGFILNFTVGKAISGITGGLISPEFIIAAFCLTILIVRPNVVQALVIGLVSAAVIQITTTSPGIDFVAEGVSAVVMALIAKVLMRGRAKAFVPAVGTFVATFVSGATFTVVKIAVYGLALQVAATMLPLVALTGVCNGILVGALYIPIRKALKVAD